MNKINLLNYTLEAMEEFFLAIGEKKFRARQVFRWIHLYNIADFDQMSDVAISLRNKLKEVCIIEVPHLFSEQKSTDGTYKWGLELADGNKIETVFIPEEGRGTLCVSSQVGCALECQFCSTARQGFNRNLSVAEIIGQLWFANFRLGFNPKEGKIITNVVMMGMGEPLANYDNVISAMKIMLEDNAYNLSRRKLTLSTSGVVPRLGRLAQDCPVSLAVSLHASNNPVRDKIVPINKKFPLETLIDACKDYLVYSPRNYITFEYIMLKGINDSLDHAEELITLFKGFGCKFNLIPFNPFPNSGFESSSMNQIVRFQRRLQESGIITTVRKTRGDDIDAACGQLVGKVKDKTKRQEKWNNYIPIKKM